MRILLTNDDGFDSCALIPTIDALEKVGKVDVVVPDKQQSWTSKANIRRDDSISLYKREVEGREITTLDALPADCANYGIYREKTPPDLLVSGANLGMNVGIAMFLSSGTIGAALEGLLAGIPSIAISCPYDRGSDLTSEKFATSLKSIPKLVKAFTSNKFDDLIMLSLNLPLGVDNSSFHAVSLDDFHFGSLFKDKDETTIEPRHYYELPTPSGETTGTDSWAKRIKVNSIIGLNRMAQIIDPSRIQTWLINNHLVEE